MDLPDIYNGIIWTESAIRYLRTSPQFAKVASHLHDSSIVQIVLAPGAKTAQGILECFESACPPRVILALDTSPTHEGIEGFPRYCAQALETGVKKINAI